MINVPIKEVAPSSPSKICYEDNEDVWLLNLDQVESNSGRILKEIHGAASDAGSSTYSFDEGNVLYSKLRPYLNKVVIPGKSGIATTELVPLRPDPEKLSREYLAGYLRSPKFVRWVSNEVAGAKMPRVSMKTFWQHEIPLPPLEEQKRIAGILDAADRLRAKRRETLAQLDTFLQSTFLELFGDPVTNPKRLSQVPLGELGTLDRGVSKHRPRNAPHLLGGDYPLIQTGDVANSEGYIREYKSTYSEAGLQQSKLWQPGTLCITIAANIASTGILTYEACFPDSIVGFKSDSSGRAEYVQGLFWFLKKMIEANAPQVAQKNINLKILRELPVPKPSLGLQKRFAAIVESVEQQKAKQRAHLAELDALFASLQSRAFNGEL